MKTYLFNDFWGTTGENQVIDTFCISTLHIKLGIVNRISSEIEKRCPEYLPFCPSIGLVKDPYNNKDYSGRYCDKLLRNLDKLEEIVSKDLLPLVETLRAFNKLSILALGKRLMITTKYRSTHLRSVHLISTWNLMSTLALRLTS